MCVCACVCVDTHHRWKFAGWSRDETCSKDWRTWNHRQEQIRKNIGVHLFDHEYGLAVWMYESVPQERVHVRESSDVLQWETTGKPVGCWYHWQRYNKYLLSATAGFTRFQDVSCTNQPERSAGKRGMTKTGARMHGRCSENAWGGEAGIGHLGMRGRLCYSNWAIENTWQFLQFLDDVPDLTFHWQHGHCVLKDYGFLGNGLRKET